MDISPKFKGISYFGRHFFMDSLGFKDLQIVGSLNLGSLCQILCPVLLWTRDVFCMDGAFASGLLRKTKEGPEETQRNSKKF